MPNAEAPCATAEATVSNQGTVVTAASTLHRTSDRQHFAHSWSALGTFVANHEHRVGLNFASHNCCHRTVFAVKHSSSSFKQTLFGGKTRNLHNAALRSKRSGQDQQSTFNVDRCTQRMYDNSIRSRWIDLGQVFGHGLTSHGHHITVQQTSIQQHLQHHRNSTDAVKIGHVEFSTRLHVGDVRNLRCDAIEVVKIKINTGFIGNCQQVQHRVGTAAQCVRQRNGILKSFLSKNVAWTNTESQHIHDGFSGATCVIFAATVNGWSRS